MNAKPEIFVIGDSISIQYGPKIEAALGENLFCDHVHFNDSVRKSQGEYIAQCIKENFVSNNHSDN